MDPVSIGMALAAQFAPSLIRRLAGDNNSETAERIIGIGRALTGSTNDADIEAALVADPALAHQFRTQAAALDVELEKAYLADRGDARDMRLELAKMGKTDWMMYAVGGIVVVGFVITVWVAFNAHLDENQRYLIFSLGGALSIMAQQVVSYFFGSSRGSKEKTAIMGMRGPSDAVR